MKLFPIVGAMLMLGASAFATDGYFSNGYSAKSRGMAGSDIAFGQD
jgi:hypothetical protein